jgi:hypothetical protein
MPQEDQSQPAVTARRTQIEDLAPAVEEMAEEDASQVSGGMIVVRGSWETTNIANSCTLNNDTDYSKD